MKKKVFLWIIFVLVATHFLKDITQDILKIPTILDLLGNANEDISNFPKVMQLVFIGIGYASFFVEIFLLIAIPLVLMNKKYIKLEKIVWTTTAMLVVYFVTAIFLDPRYSFWLSR
jgi:hypothetical protein